MEKVSNCTKKREIIKVVPLKSKISHLPWSEMELPSTKLIAIIGNPSLISNKASVLKLGTFANYFKI